MKVLAYVLAAIGLVGCASNSGIERSNLVTYGRLFRMTPLANAPDVYGRTRWTMQYDILLGNGEVLQVVAPPDPTVVVTDCLEIGHFSGKVTSLAVIDPNIGCPSIPIPNHRAAPLFR